MRDQWISVELQRPPAQVQVGLKCVTANRDFAHALGWLNLEGEWVITAFPVGETPIEITHWCELPTMVPDSPKGIKGNPWPPIAPTVDGGVLQVERTRPHQ